MSKQLTLSAAFSAFAMAAFALSQGGAAAEPAGFAATGATVEAAAPALPKVPALSGWPSLLTR